MIRSVALSLVFAAFSIVQPALLGVGFPGDVAYPLAVLGSMAVMLVGAEIAVFTLASRPSRLPDQRQRRTVGHGSSMDDVQDDARIALGRDEQMGLDWPRVVIITACGDPAIGRRIGGTVRP
jgi:hypothetical protein